EKGADVNIKDNVDGTALLYASENKQVEVVNLLIENGAVDYGVPRNLRWAASKGDCEDVQKLLEEGDDVNEKDNDGWTALHWAVFDGHEKVARLLIEHGADVDAK